MMLVHHEHVSMHNLPDTSTYELVHVVYYAYSSTAVKLYVYTLMHFHLYELVVSIESLPLK